MCFDCGCQQWDDCHLDIRHVTTLNITGSVDANGGDLTLQEVAANIVDGLQAMLDEQSAKSVQVHSHDGGQPHIHITLEPYE